MNARMLAVAVVAGALTALPTAAGANAPIFNCTYHPEWPVRKYDCTGAGVDYGTHFCEVHWTDDDANDDFTDTNSRIISSTCVGPTGVTQCQEVTFNTTWSCTATAGTTGSGTACATQTWTDNDADPNYDSGSTWQSRTLCA